MDKKKKRQLLQNREDFIAQLYQGMNRLLVDSINFIWDSCCRMFIDEGNHEMVSIWTNLRKITKSNWCWNR